MWKGRRYIAALQRSKQAGSAAGAKPERALADSVALQPLALQLAGAADGGGALAGALLGRLLVMTAQHHLAVHALALELLLERPQGLVDIIVANDDLHKRRHSPVQKALRGRTLALALMRIADSIKIGSSRDSTPRRRGPPSRGGTSFQE